jgi:hypothetical protein
MSNIYRITNENDIIEIVEHNLYKLIVVSFTTKQYKHNEFKKCLIDMASKFQNSIFLYVDVNNYMSSGNLKIYNIPETIIVYNRERCIQIDGINFGLLVGKFCEFEMKTRPITLKYISELNAYQNTMNNSKYDTTNNSKDANKKENEKTKNVKSNKPTNKTTSKTTNKMNDKVELNKKGHKKTEKSDNWNVNDVIKKLEMVKKTKETEEKILGEK